MEQLFRTYYNNAKNTDLKKDEKKFLCSFFPRLKEEDKAAVYMLIMYYFIDDGGDVKDAYPYGMDKNKKRGLDVSLTKLPYKLRNIIFNLCKMIESSNEALFVEICIKKK